MYTRRYHILYNFYVILLQGMNKINHQKNGTLSSFLLKETTVNQDFQHHFFAIFPSLAQYVRRMMLLSMWHHYTIFLSNVFTVDNPICIRNLATNVSMIWGSQFCILNFNHESKMNLQLAVSGSFTWMLLPLSEKRLGY